MALDPLETLAFDFLQSLPVSLGKKSNFRCRWILDHSDAEVGAFLDSLLVDMEKQSRFDRLKQKMAEVAGMGPRSVLPHIRAPPTTSGASTSGQAVPAPALTAPSPLPVATKKGGSSKGPAGEEGAKEDPSTDLKKKGRKRKAPDASAEEAALGADSSWVHKVSPINRAFPDDYNFREALDAGLTNGPTRRFLANWCRSSFLERRNTLPASSPLAFREGFRLQGPDGERAGLSERPSGCAYGGKGLGPGGPLLNAKIKSLTQELAVSEGERFSALARMTEVEERAKVQAVELESCRTALLKEKREAEGLAKS
ncbi:hypothetical protein PIB30_089432 [Stylosanthes scabra]|uniref:Uncharacterized protein n=1 Tax=Stylosanthes scabra TaxID=79078 RepID=A0ABU6XU83_9FABA|nr:hypothetical protein [Stylosanthes scabra]